MGNRGEIRAQLAASDKSADVLGSFLSELSFWENNSNGKVDDDRNPPNSDAIDIDEIPIQHSWKVAMDPKTGRSYYYESNTRKTQWEKVGNP